MKIIYHLGVHCTDDERLVRTLYQNADLLVDEKIIVPEPSLYRDPIRQTIVELRGQQAGVELREHMLERVTEGRECERLILSWDSFLAMPKWALKGTLYASGGIRMRDIRAIFPDHEAEFHLGVRNPAGFIGEMLKRLHKHGYEDLIGQTDVSDLRWSDLILHLQEYNPDVPITVWADEDTPLIWPEVLKAVSGHSDACALFGKDDLLASVMSQEGVERMNAYFAAHPTDEVEKRRRVVSAFMDKFALPEICDPEFFVPSWNETLVEQLTQTYMGDMAYIKTLQGVHYIEP